MNDGNTAKASRNRGDEMNYVFYKEKDGKVIATETVSEEDIKRVAKAALDVVRVYRVEAIFHMIMSALLEFNGFVFQQADFRRISEDDVLDNELFRIRINQCAATFLTALDMYKEYLHPGQAMPPFSLPSNVFCDDRFEVCKALRNYIQHVSTVGINIGWGGSLCACKEKLCYFSVSVDANEIRKNKDKMHKSSWAILNKFIDGKLDLNLFEMFNSVVDVLFAIHKEVRASVEYAMQYQNSAQFLSKMHDRLLGRGFFWYRFDGDDELECRGQIPYFYDRQRKAIDYLQRRYRCNDNFSKGSFYATTAPRSMINRMAEADRIVERYVKDEFDRGNRKITSSIFTTEKMRGWYLH